MAVQTFVALECMMRCRSWTVEHLADLLERVAQVIVQFVDLLCKLQSDFASSLGYPKLAFSTKLDRLSRLKFLLELFDFIIGWLCEQIVTLVLFICSRF